MKVSASVRPRGSVHHASAAERPTGADKERIPTPGDSVDSRGLPRGLPRGLTPNLASGANDEANGLGRKFRDIYDAWFEDVARWIRALGATEADRDDIAQEVFLVVRRRLQSFDGANPAGWLYRITRRQVRDARRRTWVKHIFNKRRSDEPEILAHGGNSPAMALEKKENQRVLHGLLQKMNEDRRSAFVLFEIEGLSGEEIARVQSVPVNTVWTRLHHARREFFSLAAKYQRAHGHPPTPGPGEAQAQRGNQRENQRENQRGKARQ
ncbi:MAG: RNA polymerase sigma factor [Deltaproteobacteria bacterium]|nr:RNA polymerase sigma factor [Deltaproteobacteria bacterium]